MPRQTHGITRETVERFIIDAGAVYVNLGLDTERLLGATQGGNTFTVEQDIKEVEVDGARGPLRGARYVVSTHARLTANLLEMTTENFKLAIAGADFTDTDEDGGEGGATHTTITRSREIRYDDYVDNIALVGKISGTDENIICIVENALVDGNIELGNENREEATLELQFTGHFSPEDVEREPWAIRYPRDVEVTETGGGA